MLPIVHGWPLTPEDDARMTQPDGYSYDVFVSYPRRGDVEPWVRNQLVPRLEKSLQEYLGREALFIDSKSIDTGVSWPDAIEFALQRSRVLLAVFSRQYFRKAWCKTELDSMLERCKQLGIGKPGSPELLVHAIVAHDCENEEHIPSPYRHIQRRVFKPFVYDHADTDWAFFRGFQDEVTSLAARIADTVDRAPKWQADFPVVRCDDSPPVVSTVPRF